jgi:hypothetical protein
VGEARAGTKEEGARDRPAQHVQNREQHTRTLTSVCSHCMQNIAGFFDAAVDAAGAAVAAALARTAPAHECIS